MPQYLSPGVYVEELEAGTRPIEGVGTAVAAFVGLAADGPLHTPTLVTNWTQFTSAFGGFCEGPTRTILILLAPKRKSGKYEFRLYRISLSTLRRRRTRRARSIGRSR